MKKLAAIPMLLLLIIALLIPVASLSFYADGYSLVLTWPTVTMAVITVLTLVLSLMAVCAKSGWFATLLAFLVPAFTMVNCLFFFAETPTVLTAVLAIVCMLGATIAALSCRRGVISFLLILLLALVPLGIVGYVSYMIFTDDGAIVADAPDTILELPSPDGTYIAEVSRHADREGKNTAITVRSAEEPVNFFCGRMERLTQQVHTMNWEDFELAELKWIDEQTLTCDGSTYVIETDSVTRIEEAEEEAAEEVVEEAAEVVETAAEAAEEVAEEVVEAVEEAAAEVAESADEAAEETVAEETEEAELAGAVVTEPAA